MKKFIVTGAVIALAALVSVSSASALENYPGYLLRKGTPGPDANVMTLQQCLLDMGFANPYGADGYFGALTDAQVRTYQRAENLMYIDGIVGPETWADLDCGEDVEVTDTDTDNMDDDSDVSDFDLNDGEEADFSNTDVNDADDDTIEEGENEAELAEIEFDLEEGGAALLERFDVVLDYVGGDSADEDDAWEVFDTIYLMVDGDIIAEENADDESDWDDSTVGDETRFRISGINHVFDAEETHTITVAADLAGSIDLGSDEQANWELTVLDNSLRFVDQAGITVYLDEESQASPDTASFTIETEGQDDELDVKSSNNDPDSTTLKVENDQASDDYTVFVFELEADRDSADVDIDHIKVTVDTNGFTSTGAGVDGIFGTGDDVTATSTYNNIVKDAYLLIDGEEFDDVTYTDGVSVILDFDIDKDFTVDSGDTVDVELVLEFKSANATNYNPGATVQGKILAYSATTGVTAEGADDLTAGGSATGDVHTLLVEGINAEMTAEDVNVVVVDGNDNDYAEFEIELDVDAFEVDAFISQFSATSIQYSIIDAANGNVAHTEAGVGTVTTGSAVASLSSSADLEGNFYRINENDTETLTLTVTYTPANVGAVSGSYRLQLDAILFEDSASAPTLTYTTIPTQDYSTGNANVTN